MSEEPMPIEMLSNVVRLANENNDRLLKYPEPERFAAVQAIVDPADLVFAIWQDSAAPNGIGHLIVKGQRRLRDISKGKEDRTVAVNAIKCVEYAQAASLRQVLGEAVLPPLPTVEA